MSEQPTPINDRIARLYQELLEVQEQRKAALAGFREEKQRITEELEDLIAQKEAQEQEKE